MRETHTRNGFFLGEGRGGATCKERKNIIIIIIIYFFIIFVFVCPSSNNGGRGVENREAFRRKSSRNISHIPEEQRKVPISLSLSLSLSLSGCPKLSLFILFSFFPSIPSPLLSPISLVYFLVFFHKGERKRERKKSGSR